MITLKSLEGQIENRLLDMMKAGKDFKALLNRNIYPIYQNAQRERWISENTTQGKQWEKLDENYQRTKLRKYASYPGGGRKILIATGRLYASVVGVDLNNNSSPDHRKLVEAKRMIIKTAVPYAEHVDKLRKFTTFGRDFNDKVRKTIVDYMNKRAAR